jgi:hypothetical protein
MAGGHADGWMVQNLAGPASPALIQVTLRAQRRKSRRLDLGQGRPGRNFLDWRPVPEPVHPCRPDARTSGPARRVTGWLALGGFACAAGLLISWALPAQAAEVAVPALRPAARQPAVGVPEDTHLDKTPPRATKSLDLVKVGWTYNCMECHQLIAAKWHYDRPMAEHRDLRLEHGNNRFCLNCHHPTDRNAFVDYDGAKIRQGDVVQLCGKCHGPTHRDWLAGVHGRQNGHWRMESGDKTRLNCIQCHDPHSPKFKDMQPLPPLRYPPRAANGPAAPAALPPGH